MDVAEMALNYLQSRNEASQFRRHHFARGLGYMVGGDNLTYDTDTLKIRNLGVQWLPYLAY